MSTPIAARTLAWLVAVAALAAGGYGLYRLGLSQGAQHVGGSAAPGTPSSAHECVMSAASPRESASSSSRRTSAASRNRRLASFSSDRRSRRRTDEGVPAGSYTLKVFRLGGEPATQQVSVPAAGSVTATF